MLEWRAVISLTATGARVFESKAPQVFDTEEAALEYGRGIARKVYGSSWHTVTVESREVGPWLTR